MTQKTYKEKQAERDIAKAITIIGVSLVCSGLLIFALMWMHTATTCEKASIVLQEENNALLEELKRRELAGELLNNMETVY